jgi:hypothetical protein
MTSIVRRSRLRSRLSREVIDWEMSARLAAGDDVRTPEGALALAELVADAVIDHFQVIPRTEDTPRYRSSFFLCPQEQNRAPRSVYPRG